MNFKPYLMQGYKLEKYTRRQYDSLIYEVMVTTIDPGEIAKGHEGGQHVFQFVAKNGTFHLWGFATIP